jgi:hypothetical protein
MQNTYLAGSLVRVANYAGSVTSPAGGFCDSNGNLGDPAQVTLRYQPGTDAETVTVTYPASPVVRDGAGLYHADLDTTGFPAGTWTYVWEGSGGVQATAQAAFAVQAAPF